MQLNRLINQVQPASPKIPVTNTYIITPFPKPYLSSYFFPTRYTSRRRPLLPLSLAPFADTAPRRRAAHRRVAWFCGSGFLVFLQFILKKIKHHYGNRLFCRAPRHTAKAKIPTANHLPCVAHGKGHTANRRRQRGPLPCAIYRAHGKAFAVCQS